MLENDHFPVLLAFMVLVCLISFIKNLLFFALFEVLRSSQQLWSCRDGQLT